MLEFVSTRTKTLAGVAIAATAGAIASGIVDHKQANAGDGSCQCGCKVPEALAEAAETVIDGAETTAEDIVNGTGK